MKKLIFISLMLFGILAKAGEFNAHAIAKANQLSNEHLLRTKLSKAIKSCDLDKVVKLVYQIKWKSVDELTPFLNQAKKIPSEKYQLLKGLGKVCVSVPMFFFLAFPIMKFGHIIYDRLDMNIGEQLGLQKNHQFIENPTIYNNLLKAHQKNSLILDLILKHVPKGYVKSLLGCNLFNESIAFLSILLAAYVCSCGFEDIFKKKSNVDKMLLIQLCLKNKAEELSTIGNKL